MEDAREKSLSEEHARIRAALDYKNAEELREYCRRLEGEFLRIDDEKEKRWRTVEDLTSGLTDSVTALRAFCHVRGCQRPIECPETHKECEKILTPFTALMWEIADIIHESNLLYDPTNLNNVQDINELMRYLNLSRAVIGRHRRTQNARLLRLQRTREDLQANFDTVRYQETKDAFGLMMDAEAALDAVVFTFGQLLNAYSEISARINEQDDIQQKQVVALAMVEERR